MPDSPNETVVIASSLTWRKDTPLHTELGARVIKFTPIVASPGVPLTLLNAVFGPRTIDRVIGVSIRTNGFNIAPTALTLADLSSGYIWQIDCGATGHLGNYCFNIETLETQCNLVLTSSVSIPASANVQVSLYNFEIPNNSTGHLG